MEKANGARSRTKCPKAAALAALGIVALVAAGCGESAPSGRNPPTPGAPVGASGGGTVTHAPAPANSGSGTGVSDPDRGGTAGGGG
jgi:hypothetical protein